MASPVAFRMTGHEQLVQRLRSLDGKARRSIHRKALTAGGKVMRQRLKSGIPRRTGAAARSLATKVKLYKSGLRGAAITGERQQGRKGREKRAKWKHGAPHLHLVEAGTQERFQTGQRAAERRLRAVEAVGDVFGGFDAARAKAGSDVALAKARSRVARALAGGRSVGRGALRDLRRGRRTGRVRPRRFWRRLVTSAAPAVHAAQAAVLKREIEAAARGG